MADDNETSRLLGRLLAQHEGMSRALARIESDALRFLAAHDTLTMRVTALETHRAATTASRKTIMSIMGVGVAIGGLLATVVKVILTAYGIV